MIGVTGSVGKTTTKEFIATLLGAKYRVGKTPGNANSQVGLPLSLLNAPGDEEIFVAEMGMNQPGEMRKLVEIIPPDVAVITKISSMHIEFFPGGVEDIAREKEAILSHSRTQMAILNEQVIGFSPVIASSLPKLVYGGEGDYRLEREGDRYRIWEKGELSPAFSLGWSAEHLSEDFLGAVAVARFFGISWEEIIQKIPDLKTIEHRFERVEKEGVVFIDDSYNAGLLSMCAALSNLPIAKEGGEKDSGAWGDERTWGSFGEHPFGSG